MLPNRVKDCSISDLEMRAERQKKGFKIICMLSKVTTIGYTQIRLLVSDLLGF